jgi:hypothetical protein
MNRRRLYSCRRGRGRAIRTARTHGIAEIAISGVNEREEGHDKS